MAEFDGINEPPPPDDSSLWSRIREIVALATFPISRRLAKVEGAQGVLKLAITWLLIGITLAVGFGYFQIRNLRTEIRGLNVKMEAIPGRLTEIANSLANNINAAQQPKTIILQHAPSPVPSSEKPSTPKP